MPQELPQDDFIIPLIFDHSVEGMLVTDGEGKIVKANPSVVKTFGYTLDELLNEPVEKLIPINLRKGHIQSKKEFKQAATSRPMVSDLDILGLHKSGKEIPLEISLSYIESEMGLLIFCFIVDISSRKRLERELKKERALIQQYLDVTSAIFLILDKRETIVMINKEGARILGVPEDELKGQNWFDRFIPESEKESVRKVFNRLMNAEEPVTEFFENTIINYQGEERLIEWHNTLLMGKDGLPKATLSSGVDITEKRALEKEKTEALVTGQENERRRLAQELHDGLGQSISAIGLNLNALEPELKNFNEKFKKIYEEVKEKLNDTIEEVRTISRNLTPKILEDFGLEHALQHLCETIDKSTTVKLTLNLNGDLLKLDNRKALGLYRIVQELVNNALKHAGPKNINVHVTLGETELIALVEDDGHGFDPTLKAEGMGLNNIRSRTELLKGEIHIDSNRKSGTTVSINIPI